MPSKKKLRPTTMPNYMFWAAKAAETSCKNGKHQRKRPEPSKPLSLDEMKAVQPKPERECD